MARPSCPDKLFDLKSEIRILRTAMRCGIRRSWHSSHQDEEQDALMESLSSLKKILNYTKNLSQIEPEIFMAPFLEIIRSEKTTGPVTSLALSAVFKIISNGHIDSNHPDTAACVEAIADAVIHTKFIRTDDSEDAVVFRKILRILKVLVLSSSGDKLSNESICEILLYFFRTCFDTRYNDAWRTTAEDYLQDMVQHLFIRLSMFADDTSDMKKMRTSNEGREKSKSKKSKKIVKPKSNSATEESTESAKSIQDQGCEDQAAADSIDNSKIVTNEVSEKSLESKDISKESDASKKESNVVNFSQELISPTEENKSFAEQIESNDNNNLSLDSSAVMNITVSQGDEVNSESKNSQLQQSLVNSVEDLSIVDDALNTKIPENKNERESKKDSKSSSNQFLSLHQHTPYSSLCIRELFRYLSSLCNPHDKQNSEIMIHLSLNLLKVALREAADTLSNFPSLLKLVKDDLTKSLILLLESDRLSIFAVNLEVSFLLFNSQREHLKFQFEKFMVKLIDIVNSDSNKIYYEQRELALETMVEFWKIPGLPTELFINYDCGLYSENLYEEFIRILSKSLVGNMYSMQFISLDAILSFITDVEERCNNQLVQKSLKQKTSKNLPYLEELLETKAKKRMLNIGSEKFNENPKKGIAQLAEDKLLGETDQADPDEVAKFLRENPTLDKKAIGEYLSKKENTNILRSFVYSFNLKNIRIDQALRQYLETFRLPGEAPLIFYLLENFAEHWSDSNDKPFASVDAAFSLAYAIIMLNVDQHNHNVKRQNIPMTAADFKKNLRGLNGNADFDQNMLDEIYTAIKNEEIVMPAEQTGVVKENYLWKCLLRRGDSSESMYRKVDDSDDYLDKELVQRAWASIITVLCKAYEKATDRDVQSRVADSFLSCAAISDFYNMTSDLDTLIVSLYKFTGLGSLPPDVEPVEIILKLGTSDKRQLATLTLFKICHFHGNALRASWKIIIDCLQMLYKANLLPTNITAGQDFVEPSGKVTLIRESSRPKSPPVEQGILSSLFSYIAPDPSRIPHPEEADAKKRANDCIANCLLKELLDDSKLLQEESLCSLVNALTSSDLNDGIAENENALENEDILVLLVELLVNVSIQNSNRVTSVWPVVKEYMSGLFTTAISKNRPYLVKRVTVSLLRLAIVLRGEQILSEVLSLLAPVTNLNSTSTAPLSRQISFGLYELLKVGAANIRSSEDWKVVFDLLECSGAGALQMKPETDPVMENANNERKSPVSELDTPVSERMTAVGPSTEAPLPVSADAIILKRNLFLHDPLSLVKCCESLIFLVRNDAYITPLNFEQCVNCVRTFAEAVLSSLYKPGRVHQTAEEPPAYKKTPLQLLELMYILHAKAPEVFRGIEKEEALEIFVWTRAWKPLLQGMSRLCCDSRKVVRSAAISSLQSTLLSTNLNQLTDSEWSECFQQVLFPLLAHLLLPIIRDDPLALEDIRFRAAMLLSKVFLRHLNLLLSLNDFLPLWLTVLNLLRAYTLVDNSENLYEAIPESLKNMLLVMSSVGVLQPNSYLWVPTWRAIHSFLPTLKNELFPENIRQATGPISYSPPLFQSPTNQPILNSSGPKQGIYPHPIPPHQNPLQQSQLPQQTCENSPLSQSPVSDSKITNNYLPSAPKLQEFTDLQLSRQQGAYPHAISIPASQALHEQIQQQKLCESPPMSQSPISDSTSPWLQELTDQQFNRQQETYPYPIPPHPAAHEEFQQPQLQQSTEILQLPVSDSNISSVSLSNPSRLQEVTDEQLNYRQQGTYTYLIPANQAPQERQRQQQQFESSLMSQSPVSDLKITDANLSTSPKDQKFTDHQQNPQQDTFSHPVVHHQIAHNLQESEFRETLQLPESESNVSPKLQELTNQQFTTSMKRALPNLLLDTKESQQIITLVHQQPSVSSPIAIQPVTQDYNSIVQEQQQTYQMYYGHHIGVVGGNNATEKNEYPYGSQMQNFQADAHSDPFTIVKASETQSTETPAMFNSAAYFTEDPAADRLFAVTN